MAELHCQVILVDLHFGFGFVDHDVVVAVVDFAFWDARSGKERVSG